MTCWVIERGAGRLSSGTGVCCEWYGGSTHQSSTRDRGQSMEAINLTHPSSPWPLSMSRNSERPVCAVESWQNSRVDG
jgi:hypothetical protein